MMLRTRTHNTLAAKKRWWNGCRYKFTGRWESRKWRVFIVKVWWDWVAAFAVGGLSRVLESRSRHWGAQNIFKARERWGYNTWIKPILTPGSLPALPKRLTFIEWQKDMGCILGHVTWQLGKIYSSWGCYCCAKSLQFSSVAQSCPTLCDFSRVQIFVTIRTAAHQAYLSMGFSRQEYWSGLPCSPPGDCPGPGVDPVSCIAGRIFFTIWATREAST